MMCWPMRPEGPTMAMLWILLSFMVGGRRMGEGRGMGCKGMKRDRCLREEGDTYTGDMVTVLTELTWCYSVSVEVEGEYLLRASSLPSGFLA